jgi:hypothetical protein
VRANDVISSIAFDLYISKYPFFCHRKNPLFLTGSYTSLDFVGFPNGGGGGSRTRSATLDFITFFITPFYNYLISLLPHFYRKNRESNSRPFLR